MPGTRTAAALPLLTLLAFAQIAEAPKEAEAPKPPPALVFEGKPLRLDFQCGDTEIDSFGLTCSTDMPCEVFLELGGIEAVGSKLFATGNFHTASATLFSILLTSSDAGKTWTEGHERMRSTGLEGIQFLDFETGWIGGQSLLALPRDPFFLRTDDGGKTWRKQSVSSESRVGAIEQFSFESKTAGALVIDRTQTGESGGRHEFYETQTGGDSWMLREVSPRPVKLKRPRTPNADLRLRADSPTKSFRIERRNGARWETVSSFLIKAGECKPAELKFAEPPPETDAAAAPGVNTQDAVTELAPYGRRPTPAKKKKK